jgi:myosin-1
MCAAAALKGKRSSWGQNRKWEGNYLARPQDNPNSAVFQASMSNLRNVDKFQMVMINSSCWKYIRAPRIHR